MGTRQEVGLVMLLVILTFLGYLPDLFSIAIVTSKPCRVGIEVRGEVERSGFVCMEMSHTAEEIAAKVGMPSSCRLERPRPGGLFEVRHDSAGNCQIQDTPMPGSHVLLAGMLIDLTNARAADLEAIPGIGPVLAERIITARDKCGGFSDLKELLSVRGIGEKRLAMLRKFVMVGEKGASITGGR